MGKFTHLMIHCTDTPPTFNVQPEDIEQWHLVDNGWSRVGYSHLITRNGHDHIMIPYDNDDVIDSWEISNGARGWNGSTKHIAYAGGRGVNGGADDNRTPFQKVALANLVRLLVMLYPDIKVIGHNQVNAGKYCPSFDVPHWAASSVGLDSANIDTNIYHG